MSWPDDAYYTLAGVGCKTHDKTILLKIGRKAWSGGLLSLTYLGDYTVDEIITMEKLAVATYGNDQGTAEAELLLIAAKHLPRYIRAELRGSVGILEVHPPEDNELVMLLVDASPLHHDCEASDVYTCAVYWVHFNFE